MPLSSFGLSGQAGCASDLYFSLLPDLFDHLVMEFFSVPHHVDFSVVLRVELWWRQAYWICCGCRNNQDVIGFIPFGIRARLPHLTKFVSEFCLIYEADSNQGWWEAVSA
jgi:hypothetical protein